jgi:hypothetical protein
MGADKNSSPKRELGLYPNSQPRIPTRVSQCQVVTTNVPTLGTNPKRPQSGSTKQEAKDLAILQQPRQTVRGHLVDCPQSTRERSATHGGLSVKHKQNDPTSTSTRGRSVPCPRTVLDVRANGLPNTFPPKTAGQLDRNDGTQKHAKNTKNT